MRFIAKTLAIVLFCMGFATAGFAADGKACANCKAASKTIVKTNKVYKNVYQHKHVKKYKDVTKKVYVNVVHRTVEVKRIIPVTNIKVITRKHVHTIHQHKRERVAGKAVYGKGIVKYSYVSVPGKSTKSSVNCGCKR